MKLTKFSFQLLVLAVTTLTALANIAATQANHSASSATGTKPDLSGFWLLKIDSKNVPRAALTSAALSADAQAQYQHDMYAIRWCNHLGMPMLMETSSPIDIRQGPVEVAIASEAVSAARHIYIDGRGHPDMATYDVQSNGHSVGHWEGDALVVDTVGFSDKGVTSIPGGGFRTENSHLTERYRLLDGGSRLSVVFTWEDAKVFAKRHSYEFRYYRAPAGTYAREYFCDASNAERAKFLSGSPPSAAEPAAP